MRLFWELAMVLINGFSRSEAEVLTGLNRNKLDYLARKELIIPEKFGMGNKKTLIYSWQQILELKAISKLRNEVSLKVISDVISFLNQFANDPKISFNKLVVNDSNVYWLTPDLTLEKLLVKIAGKGKGNVGQITHLNLLILPTLEELSEEVLEIAKQNEQVINIESFLQRSKTA